MLRALATLCLLFATPLSALAEGDRAAERYAWPVVGVKDGDTIEVHIAGLPSALNPVAIRLRGVDTPETGGRAKCGAERALAARATAFTKHAVGRGRRIEFASIGWDKYGGRIDAEIWIDDTSLAEQLIAAGLARPYGGGKRPGWC